MRAQSTKRSGWLTAGVLVLAAGCAAKAPPQVISVASHDLSCDQVDVAELGSDRFAASGCGRGAVYTQVCDTSGCRWGRLRHGHEQSIVYGQTAPGTREIIPAPPPEQRQVLPAPQPEQRQVIPAPPPAGSAGGENAAGGEPGAAAPVNVTPAPASATPTDSPLQSGSVYAQGDLSAPYEAQVPTQQSVQQVTQAPPAPLIETRPPPPVRSYVWISGYWWWGPSFAWTWVPGYWCPPYYGYAYIPGSWYWSSGYWWYGPGGWARPGSTVIIHRHVPVRPSGVAVVRSFTPHRVGPAVRSSGGVQRVVQAPRGGNYYTPRQSPLYNSGGARVTRPPPSNGGRYYSPGYSGGTRYSAPSGGSRYGAPGVGRVVAPDSAVRPRSSYGNSYSAPRGYSGGNSYSAPRSYGGGASGFSAPRNYGNYSGGSSYSAPRGGGSYSAPRGGGGGSYSAPRGGGGGGYSAPRGGGGGGSVRMSPGGGGGGGRRGR